MKLAQYEAESKGIQGFAQVEVPFPMGGVSKEKAREHITNSFAQVVDGLLEYSIDQEENDNKFEKILDINFNDIDEINQYFDKNGWTDGLPIIPPTIERVERMLKATQRDRNEIIGLMPPFSLNATVEKIAINCVMAGCLPEYFELMITVVEALLDEEFNLYGVQATTNPIGPMVIVNGPIRHQLGINGGIGLFGPGWRANATIGRAVRLMLLNIGGAKPGVGDMSTLGNPGKYSACIAELEEESPWESLHVERGFASEENTVTVVSATAPYNVIHLANNAEIFLEEIKDLLILKGTNFVIFDMEPVLVISPVHAEMLSSQGYTKQKIREVLWEKARIGLNHFDSKTVEAVLAWKSEYIIIENGEKVMNTVKKPEDIIIIHAGGHGEHSAVLGTFNRSKVVTKAMKTNIATLEEVTKQILEQFQTGFQEDGFLIKLTSVNDNRIDLQLVLTPEACLDCIMPSDYLEKMFKNSIKQKTEYEVQVYLDDPRINA